MKGQSNLLLDTHIFIWWADESDKLAPFLRRAIQGADRAYVSMVSAWEIAIKVARGKLAIRADVEQAIRASGFDVLGLTFAHTRRLAELPRGHGDPFDRMLIAQALAEDLILVSAEGRIGDYDVRLLRP
jgi:PIN domain nuclease of toxin-antitoxin system